MRGKSHTRLTNQTSPPTRAFGSITSMFPVPHHSVKTSVSIVHFWRLLRNWLTSIVRVVKYLYNIFIILTSWIFPFSLYSQCHDNLYLVFCDFIRIVIPNFPFFQLHRFIEISSFLNWKYFFSISDQLNFLKVKLAERLCPVVVLMHF